MKIIRILMHLNDSIYPMMDSESPFGSSWGDIVLSRFVQTGRSILSPALCSIILLSYEPMTTSICKNNLNNKKNPARIDKGSI